MDWIRPKSRPPRKHYTAYFCSIICWGWCLAVLAFQCQQSYSSYLSRSVDKHRKSSCRLTPLIGPEKMNSLPMSWYNTNLVSLSTSVMYFKALFWIYQLLSNYPIGPLFPLAHTGRSLVTSHPCICPPWSWRTWASRARMAATPFTFTCVGMLTRGEATGSPPMWMDSQYTTPFPAASPSMPPMVCWLVKSVQ